MVATRGHPTGLPEPTDSPSKRSLRSSGPPSPPKTTSPTSRSVSSSGSSGLWAHTPSKFTLLWMGISLPLVLWDTGYVLLRPYSMPGGSLHWPLWTPYELYGTVDHVYGFKQWNLGNGWTAAQGTVNAFETAAYLTYLYLVYKYGQTETAVKGRGAPPVKGSVLGRLAESRTVEGRVAAWAVVLMFGTTLVTFWKTVLYWLIEVYSGFDNIGHNSTVDLIFLWIIPNGAWLVAPLYLIYVFGAEILQGLESATANEKKEL